MDDRKIARAVVEEMKKAIGVKSQAKLASALGIKPPSVSEALAKGQIPERWFDILARDHGIIKLNLLRDVQDRVAGKTNTATNNGSGQAVVADGCFNVSVNQGAAGETMEVNDRERALIEQMRLHASPAMWAKIEAELKEQANRYR